MISSSTSSSSSTATAIYYFRFHSLSLEPISQSIESKFNHNPNKIDHNWSELELVRVGSVASAPRSSFVPTNRSVRSTRSEQISSYDLDEIRSPHSPFNTLISRPSFKSSLHRHHQIRSSGGTGAVSDVQTTSTSAIIGGGGADSGQSRKKFSRHASVIGAPLHHHTIDLTSSQNVDHSRPDCSKSTATFWHPNQRVLTQSDSICSSHPNHSGNSAQLCRWEKSGGGSLLPSAPNTPHSVQTQIKPPLPVPQPPPHSYYHLSTSLPVSAYTRLAQSLPSTPNCSRRLVSPLRPSYCHPLLSGPSIHNQHLPIDLSSYSSQTIAEQNLGHYSSHHHHRNLQNHNICDNFIHNNQPSHSGHIESNNYVAYNSMNLGGVSSGSTAAVDVSINNNNLENPLANVRDVGAVTNIKESFRSENPTPSNQSVRPQPTLLPTDSDYQSHPHQHSPYHHQQRHQLQSQLSQSQPSAFSVPKGLRVFQNWSFNPNKRSQTTTTTTTRNLNSSITEQNFHTNRSSMMHRPTGTAPLMKISTLVIVLLAFLIIGFIVLSPLFHYLMWYSLRYG